MGNGKEVRMGLWFLLFVGVPFVELYILLQVGEIIGILPTIIIILFTGSLGIFLMKKTGREVWYRLKQRFQSGEMPGEEILEGILVLIAGVFLITPGFLTDITGFLLLIQPIRHKFLMISKRLIEHRLFIQSKYSHFQDSIQ
jgi:UPF0716 protein FxsA